MGDDPSNAIGYFAVIMPDLNEFTGAFLLEDPKENKAVNLLMLAAMASPGGPYGALAAGMVEGFATGRPDIVSKAARAYAALTKNHYFFVVGWREPGGTRTDIREFTARTIAEAREELNQVPEVVKIKEHVMASLKGQRSN